MQTMTRQGERATCIRSHNTDVCHKHSVDAPDTRENALHHALNEAMQESTQVESPLGGRRVAIGRPQVGSGDAGTWFSIWFWLKRHVCFEKFHQAVP